MYLLSKCEDYSSKPQDPCKSKANVTSTCNANTQEAETDEPQGKRTS